MKKARTVGVLMGGRSREREVSLRTGKAALAALENLGYAVRAIDVGRDFIAQLPALAEEIDVAFIALHGSFGEDGKIQSLLEWVDIPYTSSGVLASALCFNKKALKRFLSPYQVPMARDWVYERTTPQVDSADVEQFIGGYAWSFPLIVKPNSEGSSIGVARVLEEADLLPALIQASELDPCVIVEEYIRGRELTVSVLDGQVLPLLEVMPEKGFYDYTAKYQSKTTKYEFPEDLSESVIRTITDYSRKIFQWISARGAIRIDWILSETTGQPVFLEVNTIPGMTETSLLPKAARKGGLSFEALVERILHAVAAR